MLEQTSSAPSGPMPKKEREVAMGEIGEGQKSAVARRESGKKRKQEHGGPLLEVDG